MRGKGHQAGSLSHKRRITPAYAGKSLTEKQKDVFGKDHPRLCGEKTLNRKGQTRNLGSPPPMRGKGKENQTGCCN